MKFMRITQYLDKAWIDLISIPIIVEEGIDEAEAINKGLTDMKDVIFESDKVTVYTDDKVVIFNRLDGPVKIEIIEE